jgi:hypothetical protein
MRLKRETTIVIEERIRETASYVEASIEQHIIFPPVARTLPFSILYHG